MEIIIDLTISQIKPHSGVGQYSKNIAKEMVKNDDHSFVLLLFRGDDPLGEEYLKRDNVSVYRIRRPFRIFENLIPYTAIFSSHIKQLEAQYPKAIFFSPYVLNGFPTKGFKTAVAVHDFAMPEFDHFSNRGMLTNQYRKMQYWYYMNRTKYASHIITISDSTKNDYLRYFPNTDESRISITPLGIDIQETEMDVSNYLPDNYKENGYFIYLGGGIQKNKNSIGVIKAYYEFTKRIGKEEPLPYLVIAGKIFDDINAPEMQKIRNLIKTLGIKDKVHFTGFFTDEAKYSLLKNSLGFIHLSLYEGFGIAVAEAMRSGVPVIVHNGTSYPEVVGETGFLVDGRDPSSGGEALYLVYKQRAHAKKNALRGRERSLQFEWKKTADMTLKILEGI